MNAPFFRQRLLPRGTLTTPPGRKTHRTQSKPRTPPHLLPDWRLSFVPPPGLTFALAPGPLPGVLGAHVGDLGQIDVIGKSRDWVIGRAALAWAAIARGHHARIKAVLVRGDEPGPTLSGPIRKGATIPCVLEINGSASVRVEIGRSFRLVAVSR